MVYKGVNASWKAYESDKCDNNLTKLLESVRKQVCVRLRRQDEAFEDIAQNVVIKVWQAVILGVYDPERGDLAAFVTTVARTERIDYHKYDRLVPVSENLLEEMQLDGVLNKGFKSYKGQDPVAFETGEK